VDRKFTVTTSTSVCADEYYVFIRTREGCYSDPAKVIVKTFYCPTDLDRADLAITKTASKTAVARGEAVTYTVTVTNNGPDVAKNVELRDILPAGLDLQVYGAPMNFNIANGVITKSIYSLSVNQSVTIQYSAKLTQPGTVTNTAEIAYSDVVDLNAANNKASATVTNLATFKPGMIGIAKNASAKLNNDGTFEASFQFRLTNYGDTKLTNVQVTDDLTTVFGSHSIVSVSVQPALGGAGYTLAPNAAYTGKGSNTNLLDAANSSINAGSTGLLMLTVYGVVNPADASRAFSNSALASAMSGTAMLQDASVAGADADPDGDSDPTNNTGPANFTLAQPQAVPGIGVALAVQSVEKQNDGTVKVVYVATVKNYGDKPLNDVQLTDDLTKTFTSPATFTVVGTASNSLSVNTAFNGSSVSTLLGAGNSLAEFATTTVSLTVNVTPNGAAGPFYNTVIASGTPQSTSVVIQDVSNTGYDPTPAGETPTVVRFDLPNALLGVAKLVGTPVSVSGTNGQWDIPYTISVTNFGTEDLTNLQVTDDLSAAFNGAGIVSSTLAVQTSSTALTANPNYTGQGMVTKLLSGTANTLAKGQTATLKFTVRVDISQASSLTFNNTAIATAQAGTAVTSDTSTSGTNPDPTNTLNPTLSNDPTPVTLNNANITPFIGLAMTVRDTVRQADGSYNITYAVVVKNYSGIALGNVSVSDSLANVFTTQDGVAFKVVSTQVGGTGSGLVINPAFDGSADTRLTLPTGSSLAAGRTDTLYFVVNVMNGGSKETFLNSAIATAQAGTVKVSDISTNGINPDINGNRNPTDSNEGEATPVSILSGEVNIFIPEGFSPNGDNVNDRFVIRGAQTQTLSLEVYNRWGLVVYKNDDYKNDWDGTANTGVKVGASTSGLPEGTYFYRVKLSDGKVYVRYMTINR
jgi:large repetitive protein